MPLPLLPFMLPCVTSDDNQHLIILTHTNASQHLTSCEHSDTFLMTCCYFPRFTHVTSDSIHDHNSMNSLDFPVAASLALQLPQANDQSPRCRCSICFYEHMAPPLPSQQTAAPFQHQSSASTRQLQTQQCPPSAPTSRTST